MYIDYDTFFKAYRCLIEANILLDNGLGNFNSLGKTSLDLIGKKDVKNTDRLDMMSKQCLGLATNMFNTIQCLAKNDSEVINYFNDIFNDEEFADYLSFEDDSNLKPKNNHDIAHRGFTDGGKYADNSREAITAAGDNGYWGCEVDVMFDKDGNLVCAHDNNYLTRQISAGNKPTTFEEYLDICKEHGMTAIIDLKYENNGGTSLSPEILKVIEEKGMMDSCILQTNKPWDLSNIRENSVDARIWYLADEVSNATLDSCIKNNVEGVNTRKSSVADRFVANGMQACMWSVNDMTSKENALKHATYVMSDYVLGITPYQEGQVDVNNLVGNDQELPNVVLLGNKNEQKNQNSVNNNVFGMLYDQSQYNNITYGGGTLSSDGCGFFSVLSAITAKTGHVFSEEEISAYADKVNTATKNGELTSANNDGRMEYLMNQLSKDFNFSWSKGAASDITSSLTEGNAVISLINSSSHFVAITGVTEDGNVIVNDSDGNKYRANPTLRNRVDNVGFNLSNGELQISKSGVDKNGDGINDDVWYLSFENSQAAVEDSSNKIDNLESNNDTVVKTNYSKVPLYFQTDYSDVQYGPSSNDTVASDGCGITSLAMVASYLTGKEILPDQLAKQFASKATGGGSCWTLFRDSQEPLGITVEDQTWDFNKVYEALKNGQVVIANARESSVFTGGGHFIVLTGLTEDGKVLVNDPYKGNYERADHAILQDGFENGFDPSLFDSSGEMSQFWIYAPKSTSVETVKNDVIGVFDDKTTTDNKEKDEQVETDKSTEGVVSDKPETDKLTDNGGTEKVESGDSSVQSSGTYNGQILSTNPGVNYYTRTDGVKMKETYCDLNFGVSKELQDLFKYDGEKEINGVKIKDMKFWVREDGVQMLGDFACVATTVIPRNAYGIDDDMDATKKLWLGANCNYGDVVETSVGPGIVVGRCGEAYRLLNVDGIQNYDIYTYWNTGSYASKVRAKDYVPTNYAHDPKLENDGQAIIKAESTYEKNGILEEWRQYVNPLDSTQSNQTSIPGTQKPTETVPPVQSETQNPTETVPSVQYETQNPTETVPSVEPETQKPTQTIPPVQYETQNPTETVPSVEPETQKPMETIPMVESEIQKPMETTPTVEPEIQESIESETFESINLNNIDVNSGENGFDGKKLVLPGILGAGLAFLGAKFGKIMKKKRKNDEV